MHVGNEDTKSQTLITYVGPSTPEQSNYLAATILFAEDFDTASLPKSARARRLMTIDCTPRADNQKNETGVKRLRSILKGLEGTKVKIITPYSNSITEEDFFARAS